VETVAVRRGLAIVRLTRRDVEDVRIGWREREIGDRRCTVGVEHRLEGRAVVRRLYDAADGVTDVLGGRVLFIDGEIVDADALSDGADRAPPEAAEERVGGLIDERARRIRRRLLGHRRRRET